MWIYYHAATYLSGQKEVLLIHTNEKHLTIFSSGFYADAHLLTIPQPGTGGIQSNTKTDGQQANRRTYRLTDRHTIKIHFLHLNQTFVTFGPGSVFSCCCNQQKSLISFWPSLLQLPPITFSDYMIFMLLGQYQFSAPFLQSSSGLMLDS